MSPIAFSILGFNIYWYGFAYFFCFIFGSFLSKYYIKSYKLNLDSYDIDDLLIWLVFGVILGGRTGYFLFYEPNLLKEFFLIRDGGMSFHGGIIGGIISVFIYSKFNNKNFFLITDLVSVSSPIGIFLGRIANYINNDEIPGIFYFGIKHPVVLYEALFEGAILFCLLNYHYRYNFKSKGKVSALFLLYYGIFRITLDFLKDEIVFLHGMTIGQVLCVPMIIFGIYFLTVKKKFS